MFKHVIFLILLSIIAVIFQTQLAYMLRSVLDIHDHLINFLGLIFSEGNWGSLIQSVLALLVIPVIVALLLCLIFWVAKRGKVPHLSSIVWVIWIILTTVLILENSLTVNDASVWKAQQKTIKK